MSLVLLRKKKLKKSSLVVRGRNDHYWPSPAQIRTSPIKASGFYQEYLAGSRVSRCNLPHATQRL